MKFKHIISYINAHPWAILPEKLDALLGVVSMRAEGGKLSNEEIAENMGAFSHSREASSSSGVAVLPIRGVIAHRMDSLAESSGGVSAERLGHILADVRSSESIHTLILDIDSPGGSVHGITELFTELMAARESLRIVAVANAMGASAAYWLASAADEIVITPSGLVGSIGIIAAHVDQSKQDDMEGIKVTVKTAGKFKHEGDPHEELSAEAAEFMQQRADEFYEMFIADVAKGRDVKISAVRGGFGEGRMLSAAPAVREGLADRIATLSETITVEAGRRRRPKARHRPKVRHGGEDSTPKIQSQWRKPMSCEACGSLEAGERLARLLNDLIDDRTDDDTDRADVILRMADAAGISPSTVNQILTGAIICPPLDRLAGFARALNVPLSRLRSAAESDGCEYGDGDEDDAGAAEPEEEAEVLKPELERENMENRVRLLELE